MSDKNYKYEADAQEPGPGEVEVADMRHSRELAEPPAPPAPPEPPAAAPAAPAPPPPAPVAAAPEPPEDAPEVETEIGMHAEAEPHEPHEGEDAASAFEMEQLRLLFGGGLTVYLRSQIGLLFNFALISLGRMPNPATGIVAIDLDKAKLAIDMFEFIVLRIQAELEPNERAETLNLVKELKYAFMQQAQAATPQSPLA
jgi:hypothetical protein